MDWQEKPGDTEKTMIVTSSMAGNRYDCATYFDYGRKQQSRSAGSFEGLECGKPC